MKAARKDGRDEDDSEEEAEEHKQSLREEIERKYFPEREFAAPFACAPPPRVTPATRPAAGYEFWPFGDPFIEKRKAEARRKKQTGHRQWYDED